MRTEPDVTRVVRSWLEQGVTELPDRVLDNVLDQLPATRQRRPLWSARRFLDMNSTLKLAIAAAAVVAVAVAGVNLLPGRGDVAGPPAIPTATPTATPSHEPSPTVPYVVSGPVSGPGSTAVAPGTYRMRGPGASPAGWPSTVIVTIPDGWEANSVLRGAGLTWTGDDGQPLARLSFSSVGKLFADPCASRGRGDAMLEPPLGPSVDELVAGLRSLPVFEFTEPVDVTLDGWAARRLQVTHPAGCGEGEEVDLWRTPPDAGETWGISSREGWHSTLWVLDVDGLRFVVIAAYELDARGDVRLELERMVDSIDIEP